MGSRLGVLWLSYSVAGVTNYYSCNDYKIKEVTVNRVGGIVEKIISVTAKGRYT